MIRVLRMSDVDLKGKRVLIREDLNVPVKDGVVTSDARIRASLPTIAAAQKAGARVLLLGMRLPPNYGPAYTREFDALFASVAAARKTALVPFIFDGFGDDNTYFQADRIHPTAAAQPRLLANVWPALVPLLGKRPVPALR